MKCVIPRNTTIPSRKTVTLTTSRDNQSSVHVRIFEGERALARDCNCLARVDLTGIPPMPRGVPQIEVTFDIDANGILNVTAKEMSTQKQAQVQIRNESGRLSQDDINRMVREATDYRAEDEEHRRRVTAQHEQELKRAAAVTAEGDLESFLGRAERLLEHETVRGHPTALKCEGAMLGAIVTEARRWLARHPDATPSVYTEKVKELVPMVGPLVTKLQHIAHGGGDAFAARLSRGSEEEGEVSDFSNTEPKRAKMPITVTVQLFNVVSGGVPSASDVKAAIDDMEALYAACRWSGWMSNDPGLAHMRQVVVRKRLREVARAAPFGGFTHLLMVVGSFLLPRLNPLLRFGSECTKQRILDERKGWLDGDVPFPEWMHPDYKGDQPQQPVAAQSWDDMMAEAATAFEADPSDGVLAEPRWKTQRRTYQPPNYTRVGSMPGAMPGGPMPGPVGTMPVGSMPVGSMPVGFMPGTVPVNDGPNIEEVD